MRITESKLRKLIRSVIAEAYSDADIEHMDTRTGQFIEPDPVDLGSDPDFSRPRRERRMSSSDISDIERRLEDYYDYKAAEEILEKLESKCIVIQNSSLDPDDYEKEIQDAISECCPDIDNSLREDLASYLYTVCTGTDFDNQNDFDY